MNVRDEKNNQLRKLRALFDTDRWQEIWQTIRQNKSRSILTGFGVFWGMFMLVVMVGMGNALKDSIQKEVAGVATNTCFVSNLPTTQPYKGFKKGRNWYIIDSDIGVLQNNIPQIEYISPVLFGNFLDERAILGRKKLNVSSKGVYPQYNHIEHSDMKYGRFINPIDISQERKVCVIGEKIYETLFEKGENPIGKFIQLGGIYLQVIGVNQSSSNVTVGGNPQTSVLLPFTTMQKISNQGNRIHLLVITAAKGVKVSLIEQQVKQQLAKLHDISPSDDNAFMSMNMEVLFNTFLYLGLGIAILIWIVGLGTLTAGGIGVSNIMLVTVRERTKEIGIKRALGATPSNIITQIMTESLILTLIAGFLGILMGIGVLQTIDLLTKNQEVMMKNPQISFSIAISSFVLILIVGLLAGLLPASRAISIKAIAAINQEN